MKIAIYAGSFDPITNGHIDILKTGAQIFDKVIIAVSFNPNKIGFLPVETRIRLIQDSVKNLENVEVDFFDGLTVDYAKKKGAIALLRGLRSSVDFEYENQMAQFNQALDKNIKTIFVPSSTQCSFISSSGIREILKNKGDITEFVPKPVLDYFKTEHGGI